MKAKLEKVVVFQKGDRISKLEDSHGSQSKSLFARLIIQLPTMHSGGNLVLYDGSIDHHTVDLGQQTGSSRFSLFMAAFYAGVDYEISEITTGHSIALVYSLSTSTGNQNDSFLSSFQFTFKLLSHLDSNYFIIVFNKENKNKNMATNGLILKRIVSLFNSSVRGFCFVFALNADYSVDDIQTHGLDALEGFD